MAELEAQTKSIRVPVSVWAIAYHIVRSGKDTFSQRELEGASCDNNINSALVTGLIERLDNGLYKANIDLAKFYVSLLPRVPRAYVVEHKGRFSVSEAKISCEERKEAVRLARAWAKLANWATAHAEDEEELPKDIVEVLNRHGIQVRRMVLPGGAKAVVAKVLSYYIIMDSLMVKNSPKCVRFPKLGPDALLCASTREKLYWYLIPLTLRPQN
jgi:hypothetical protein